MYSRRGELRISFTFSDIHSAAVSLPPKSQNIFAPAPVDGQKSHFRARRQYRLRRRLTQQQEQRARHPISRRRRQ